MAIKKSMKKRNERKRETIRVNMMNEFVTNIERESRERIESCLLRRVSFAAATSCCGLSNENFIGVFVRRRRVLSRARKFASV